MAWLVGKEDEINVSMRHWSCLMDAGMVEPKSGSREESQGNVRLQICKLPSWSVKIRVDEITQKSLTLETEEHKNMVRGLIERLEGIFVSGVPGMQYQDKQRNREAQGECVQGEKQVHWNFLCRGLLVTFFRTALMAFWGKIQIAVEDWMRNSFTKFFDYLMCKMG